MSLFGHRQPGRGQQKKAAEPPEAFCLGLPARPYVTFSACDWDPTRTGEATTAPQCVSRLGPLVGPVRGLWPAQSGAPGRGLRIVFSPEATIQLGQGRELVGNGDRLLPVIRRADGSRQIGEVGRVVLGDGTTVTAAAVAAWQVAAMMAGRDFLAEIDARLTETGENLARTPPAAQPDLRARVKANVTFLRQSSTAIQQCGLPSEDRQAVVDQFEAVERAALAAGETTFNELQRLWIEVARLNPITFWQQEDSLAEFIRRIDEWELNAGLFLAAQCTAIAGCGVRALSPVQKDPSDRRLGEVQARSGKFADHCAAFRQTILEQTRPRSEGTGAPDGDRKSAVDRSVSRTQTAEASARELIEQAKHTAKHLTDPLSLNGAALRVDLHLGRENEVLDFRVGADVGSAQAIVPPLPRSTQ